MLRPVRSTDEPKELAHGHSARVAANVLDQKVFAQLPDELPIEGLATAVEPTDHPGRRPVVGIEQLQGPALAGDADRLDFHRIQLGNRLTDGSAGSIPDLVDILLDAAVGRVEPVHPSGAVGDYPAGSVDHHGLDVGGAQVQA